jgi:hypothetical protein
MYCRWWLNGVYSVWSPHPSVQALARAWVGVSNATSIAASA